MRKGKSARQGIRSAARFGGPLFWGGRPKGYPLPKGGAQASITEDIPERVFALKLIYKGNYKGEEQPPKGELPADAVRFDEPETPEELTKAAFRFAVPTVLLVALVVLLSAAFSGGFKLNLFSPYLYLGALLFLPCPRLCTRSAAGGRWISSFRHRCCSWSACTHQQGRSFHEPVAESVLGWLPFWSGRCCPMARCAAICCFPFRHGGAGQGGDYLNAFNALRQMPKGSMQRFRVHALVHAGFIRGAE